MFKPKVRAISSNPVNQVKKDQKLNDSQNPYESYQITCILFASNGKLFIFQIRTDPIHSYSYVIV